MSKWARTSTREDRDSYRATRATETAREYKAIAVQTQESETGKLYRSEGSHIDRNTRSQQPQGVLLKQIRHLNNLYTKCMDPNTGRTEIWSSSSQSNMFVIGEINSL